MTSKCSQSASATRCDSSASRAKSADSRLGAISGSRGTGPESTEDLRGGLTLPVLRDLDLTGGVAVRLSSLCLDDKGRLRDFALWDDAARGALLVDLTRTGRRRRPRSWCWGSPACAFGMPEPIVDDELAPVGELRWICEAVTAHLETAHRGNLRAAGAADGGSNPYF